MDMVQSHCACWTAHHLHSMVQAEENTLNWFKAKTFINYSSWNYLSYIYVGNNLRKSAISQESGVTKDFKMDRTVPDKKQTKNPSRHQVTCCFRWDSRHHHQIWSMTITPSNISTYTYILEHFHIFYFFIFLCLPGKAGRGQITDKV